MRVFLQYCNSVPQIIAYIIREPNYCVILLLKTWANVENHANMAAKKDGFEVGTTGGSRKTCAWWVGLTIKLRTVNTSNSFPGIINRILISNTEHGQWWPGSCAGKPKKSRANQRGWRLCTWCIPLAGIANNGRQEYPWIEGNKEPAWAR